MRKLFCISVIFLFCLNVTSQVLMSNGHFEKLDRHEKELYLKIKRIDSMKTLAVSNYISIHGLDKKVIRNGKTAFILTDVIEGKPIYTSTDNADAAEATGTNHLQIGGSLGLDLDGAGFTVGVWDGGPIQLNHTEFQNTAGTASRALNLEGTNTDGGTSQDQHATHVSGTISARGVNPSAKGMATAVNVRTYNFLNDTPEMMTALSNPSSPLFLTNHSYGVPVEQADGTTLDSWFMGSYRQGARAIDEISRMYPKYLMVASAGNSGNTNYSGGLFNGFDKLTTDKVAKNNLVIANANPSIGPFGGNLTLVINSSSSQGPSDDLRIKPDIAADGTNLFSTSVNDGYATLTGTSMAAPNTTGSLVLLQQYYDQLYGEYMNSSTLKGLVCHTATDDSVIGPDPVFGWGFLNAKFAAETITASNNDEAILNELTLSNGQTYTNTFSAQAGDNIRATICWSDLPGVAVANGDLNNLLPRLINDLDIRISKDGNTFLPWRLVYSSSAGFSNTKDDNITDNVERIDFDAPSSGTYTITVNHKGTLLGNTGVFPGDQNFSLIVTGNNLSLSTNDNLLSSNLVVFPNPNNGEFTINFESKNNNEDYVNVEIYDLSGRLIYNNTFINRHRQFNEQINLSKVVPGVYVVNIISGTQSTSQKIIVE